MSALEKAYPDAKCSLNYKNAYELLIATRLSAQCKDSTVNLVTPALFTKYPTPEALGNAKVEDIENIIKICGLYKTKARDIKMTGERLHTVYGDTVPDSMEELLTLSGIGRKTANLVLGDIYKKSTVVTDTHFIRIMGRLGFTDTSDPYKVEMKMAKLLSGLDSSSFCHRVVIHGRQVCTARRPDCENCCLNNLCEKRI